MPDPLADELKVHRPDLAQEMVDRNRRPDWHKLHETSAFSSMNSEYNKALKKSRTLSAVWKAGTFSLRLSCNPRY